MKTYLIIGIFLISIIGFYFILDDNRFNYYDDTNKLEEVVNMNEDKVYQGPVPEGYDLEYFRNTGETIKEVSE